MMAVSSQDFSCTGRSDPSELQDGSEIPLWKAESSGVSPEVHGSFLPSGNCFRAGGWSQFLGDRALPSYFTSTFSVIEQTLYLCSEFGSEFGISIEFTYAQIFFFTLVIKISATILNSK